MELGSLSRLDVHRLVAQVRSGKHRCRKAPLQIRRDTQAREGQAGRRAGITTPFLIQNKTFSHDVEPTPIVFVPTAECCSTIHYVAAIGDKDVCRKLSVRAGCVTARSRENKCSSSQERALKYSTNMTASCLTFSKRALAPRSNSRNELPCTCGLRDRGANPGGSCYHHHANSRAAVQPVIMYLSMIAKLLIT